MIKTYGGGLGVTEWVSITMEEKRQWCERLSDPQPPRVRIIGAESHDFQIAVFWFCFYLCAEAKAAVFFPPAQ